MDSDASPIAMKPTGLHAPISAATCAGIRKIAAPITWLIPIAVRSQRPSARRSVVIGCRLYHERAMASEREGLSRAMLHTTLPRRFYADPDFYRVELDR